MRRRRGRPPEVRRAEAIARLPERFWSYVDKTDPDGCWLWVGYTMATGYGGISIAGKHEMLTTHRLSWELHNGPIPPGMHVLHSCDVRACVNPAHLHLGTQAENMREKAERGRARTTPRFGEDNNKAKLTAAQVREMRERYADGNVSIRALAREYGVTFAPVQAILSGKSWRHVS